jgi:hypothetical protein
MISIARRCVVPLSVVIAAVWGGSAMAATQSFEVPLVGSQEVPSVESAGQAVAELTYDPATRMLTWAITYVGLSGPVTMAHFHGPAAKGENAAPQISLTKQGSPAENPIKGQATLSPEQAKDFVAGKWYVNLHTQAHPAGEIRGQVVPPKG